MSSKLYFRPNRFSQFYKTSSCRNDKEMRKVNRYLRGLFCTSHFFCTLNTLIASRLLTDYRLTLDAYVYILYSYFQCIWHSVEQCLIDMLMKYCVKLCHATLLLVYTASCSGVSTMLLLFDLQYSLFIYIYIKYSLNHILFIDINNMQFILHTSCNCILF